MEFIIKIQNKIYIISYKLVTEAVRQVVDFYKIYSIWFKKTIMNNNKFNSIISKINKIPHNKII
jgi:hypothetical protein